MDTIRICGNLSGNKDFRIVPEDIFVSDIEPSLVIDKSVDYLSNKSFYNKWFPEGIFPRDMLHRICGVYYNSNLVEIDIKSVRKIIVKQQFPVVFKPNRLAYGGKGIYFVKNAEELLHLVETKDDFVVQERILQHDFFSRYNTAGLNTIRVYLYRSVSDHKLHILTMALRMGLSGSLDNETAGGIHTMIRPDGRLNGYAVDKYCKKYEFHPDNGMRFNDKIPDYEGLKKFVIDIGGKVFLTRIIGLDICYDVDNNWRAIEINTHGHAVRFAQYGGFAFFGEHTQEVIEYCRNHHWTFKPSV